MSLESDGCTDRIMVGNQVVSAVRGRVRMVFQAFNVRSNPDKVDDALLVFFAPGIVGRDVFRIGSNIVCVEHHRLQWVEDRAGDVRVEVSGENEGKPARIDLPHFFYNEFNALFLGFPGEAEMRIEIIEALPGLNDLEKTPGEGTVVFFVEGGRGDVGSLRHPEGAAVKKRKNGAFVQEPGSLTLVHTVVPADTYAAVSFDETGVFGTEESTTPLGLEADDVRPADSEHLQTGVLSVCPVIGGIRLFDVALADVETYYVKPQAARKERQQGCQDKN